MNGEYIIANEEYCKDLCSERTMCTTNYTNCVILNRYEKLTGKFKEYMEQSKDITEKLKEIKEKGKLGKIVDLCKKYEDSIPQFNGLMEDLRKDILEAKKNE